MIQYVTKTGSLVSCPCMLQGIAGKVYEYKENLGFIPLAKIKKNICNITQKHSKRWSRFLWFIHGLCSYIPFFLTLQPIST